MGLLKAEQFNDDTNKAYCVKSFDKTVDEAKVLVHQIVGHKDTLEDYEGQLSNSDDHIVVVKMSISGLDPAWQRPLRSDRLSILRSHSGANNAAATQLLILAVERLNKFFSPKLHKASPKAELSAGFSFYVNVGGEITTAAPTCSVGAG